MWFFYGPLQFLIVLVVIAGAEVFATVEFFKFYDEVGNRVFMIQESWDLITQLITIFVNK